MDWLQWDRDWFNLLLTDVDQSRGKREETEAAFKRSSPEIKYKTHMFDIKHIPL